MFSNSHPELTGHEKHPVLLMPDPEQLAAQPPEKQAEVWASRKEAMVRMIDNPLLHGYEPPSWARADRVLKEFREAHPVGVLIFLILGGHRAGKTTYLAKRTVQALFNHPDYKVWACGSTQEASREAQQVPIYQYLPPVQTRERQVPQRAEAESKLLALGRVYRRRLRC